MQSITIASLLAVVITATYMDPTLANNALAASAAAVLQQQQTLGSSGTLQQQSFGAAAVLQQQQQALGSAVLQQQQQAVGSALLGSAALLQEQQVLNPNAPCSNCQNAKKLSKIDNTLTHLAQALTGRSNVASFGQAQSYDQYNPSSWSTWGSQDDGSIWGQSRYPWSQQDVNGWSNWNQFSKGAWGLSSSSNWDDWCSANFNNEWADDWSSGMSIGQFQQPSWVDQSRVPVWNSWNRVVNSNLMRLPMSTGAGAFPSAGAYAPLGAGSTPGSPIVSQQQALLNGQQWNGKQWASAQTDQTWGTAGQPWASNVGAPWTSGSAPNWNPANGQSLASGGATTNGQGWGSNSQAWNSQSGQWTGNGQTWNSAGTQDWAGSGNPQGWSNNNNQVWSNANGQGSANGNGQTWANGNGQGWASGNNGQGWANGNGQTWANGNGQGWANGNGQGWANGNGQAWNSAGSNNGAIWNGQSWVGSGTDQNIGNGAAGTGVSQCAEMTPVGTLTNATLTCPAGQVIQSITQAAWGQSSGTCQAAATAIGQCTSDVSSTISRMCLNQNICSFGATPLVLGSPISTNGQSCQATLGAVQPGITTQATGVNKIVTRYTCGIGSVVPPPSSTALFKPNSASTKAVGAIATALTGIVAAVLLA